MSMTIVVSYGVDVTPDRRDTFHTSMSITVDGEHSHEVVLQTIAEALQKLGEES